jgi:hypothetical protein
MLSTKSLVKKLDVFERNKVPLELKVLGLAFYSGLINSLAHLLRCVKLRLG